jgi:putative FmdB family regulatory protein
MPLYDYVCIKNHITELNLKREELKEVIDCPLCKSPATRSFKNMGIRSNVKYGTGGGRDMKQS